MIHVTLTVIGLALIFSGLFMISKPLTMIVAGLLILSTVGIRVLVEAAWNGIVELDDELTEVSDGKN
jgi:cobalamin biosynthesis protein CobD/CbiB